MSPTKLRSLAGRSALGLFFALTGTSCLVAIRFHSSRSLANSNDPGPWLMPKLLGSLLLIGGILFILRNTIREPGSTDSATTTPDHGSRQSWILLAGVVTYVVGLPWAGFLIATPVFVFTMLSWLKIKWWKALVAAVLLTGTGQLVFVRIFMTPLPTGFWN